MGMPATQVTAILKEGLKSAGQAIYTLILSILKPYLSHSICRYKYIYTKLFIYRNLSIMKTKTLQKMKIL